MCSYDYGTSLQFSTVRIVFNQSVIDPVVVLTNDVTGMVSARHTVDQEVVLRRAT